MSQGRRHQALERIADLGVGAGKPSPNAQTHQGNRPDVVEEWKWMAHWFGADGIICTEIQECREAYVREGRL
jgi:hypothetical protein